MYKIGHAWDTHKLVSGRKLYLGGVFIESEIGLLGHSDADVVLHAIAESFLGAMGLGDLGTFFPDTDVSFKDMDSAVILKECYLKVLNCNFELSNLDLTIYSEYIKISPIREKIKKSISDILNVLESKINIKATTHEKMGFIGRGEAIACECVCLCISQK